jgi:6-phosphogluconolactonase
VRDSELIVWRDLADLSRKAAEEFVRLANQVVSEKDCFTVALSGGSTPKELYSLLAAPEFAERIPWPKVHLFWGDERCVAPDHPESNYRMVKETLLSKVPIPEKNVHRMKGEEDPRIAARNYEQTLRKFFALSEGEFPRFDLVLLGLGRDGHMASLFPGSAALHSTNHLVAAVASAPPQPNRLTLTLPVINRAAHIIFLVAGKDKAAALRDALGAENDPVRFPSQSIKPGKGKLTWLVDQDAAFLL